LDLIIDTQILSYHFKGVDKDISSQNLAISSITANEFLLAQPNNSEKPDYYTI
jgi:predicted nucleic acid-binding protein